MAELQHLNLAQIDAQAQQYRENKMRAAMLQAQMAEQDRNLAAQRALDSAWTSAGTPEAGLAALEKMSPAGYKQAMEFRAKQAETANKQASTRKLLVDADKDTQAFIAQSASLLINKPDLSHQDIASVLDVLGQRGYKVDHLRSMIPGDPAKLKPFVMAVVGAGASPDKIAEMNTANPQAINLGGSEQIVDMNPITNPQAVGTSLTRTATPDSIMTDARVRSEGEKNREVQRQEIAMGGKPPPGYRFKEDGSLEAIPGGPADIKAGELGAKRERQQQAAVAQADRLISKVDSALSKVGIFSAGSGSMLANVPGTKAKDLQTDLETIKANLGFAELQAMRDASPTGGALGAIAVQELNALQSTLASLDQAQSQDQLKANLGQIRTHYKNWKEAVSGGGQTPAAKPKTGEMMDGYMFLGGDPADPKRWRKASK